MIRSRNEILLMSRAANYMLVLVMLSRETTDDVVVSFFNHEHEHEHATIHRLIVRR